MGLLIKTSVFPLRVSLRKKEPWELNVEVHNEGSKDKMVSVRIDLPDEANFSTVGITRAVEKRFNSFRAGATETIKLPVYLSNASIDGTFFGKVKAAEHFNDYSYVERSYAKEIPFKIVP